MTHSEKKKKAALIAAAYYIEHDILANKKSKPRNAWAEMGHELIMENRLRIQRRGRVSLGV